MNLLGFQPAEIIRILLVFFLAGYFAERWEFLRTLRESRVELAKVSRWVEVPRLEYLLPVLAGVVLSLAFFFLQKDLGPALLIACMFLAMYAVARDRYLFAAAGLLLIFLGFASGYYLHFPSNVAGRVSMWLSPWDNSVRGGEQLAHALWGFSTGGLFGTGLGLGDPQLMPAAHTDLILATLGEEWGFAGLFCVLALYAGLVWFGIRTALRARSDYNFFLALGLTLAFALADRTDRRRRAGADPAVGRCCSVSELRQNCTHHQLRTNWNPFLACEGGHGRTGHNGTVPGEHAWSLLRSGRYRRGPACESRVRSDRARGCHCRSGGSRCASGRGTPV